MTVECIAICKWIPVQGAHSFGCSMHILSCIFVQAKSSRGFTEQSLQGYPVSGEESPPGI